MQLTFSVDDRQRLAQNLRELTIARAGGAPYAPLHIILVMDNGDEHLVTRAAVIEDPMPAIVWGRPEIGDSGVIDLNRLVQIKADFVGGFSLKETKVEKAPVVKRGAGVP